MDLTPADEAYVRATYVPITADGRRLAERFGPTSRMRLVDEPRRRWPDLWADDGPPVSAA